MGLTFLMLTAMSAWFFYDYKIGYPKKAAIHAEYERVMALPGGDTEWKRIAGEKGWNADKSPEPMPVAKIEQQRTFAIIPGVVALGVLIRFLLQRRTTLKADATSFTTPAGRRIPFEKVFRVDKRKWRHKGLATVFHRDEQGAEKRDHIDDLKYHGADQILDRLLGRFSGELVDLDEPAATPDAQGESGPPKAA